MSLIEPTQLGQQHPYEMPNPYYGSLPDIPPPPPKQGHKYLRVIIISVVLVIAVVVGTIVFNIISNKPVQSGLHSGGSLSKITPTIAPTTTVATEYTASDILEHLQAVDNSIIVQSTGGTIWNFSHENYYVVPHATSSVQFSGCPIGDCADTWHYGLWVYATTQDAQTAYSQVYTNSQTCNDNSPVSDGMYVVCANGTQGLYEQEYSFGRCLLLNANSQSIYGQTIAKYCT